MNLCTAASEPPFSQVRENLLAGNLSQAVSQYNLLCLRQEVKISLEDLPRDLLPFLLQNGCNWREVQSPLLEPRDEAYLRRIILLTKIAAYATNGSHDNREKAGQLFEFVTDQMTPEVRPDSYDYPEEMLLRGYGSCDQMAWALCALAEQSGFETMLVFLNKPGAKQSHHTIAALRFDGKWALFDPFCGLSYGYSPGEPGLFEMLPHPEKIDGKIPAESLFRAEYLPWCSFLAFTQPRGMLPRWSIFAQSVDLSEITGRIWLNSVSRLKYFQTEAAMAFHCQESELDKVVSGFSTVCAEKYGVEKAKGLIFHTYGEPFNVNRLKALPGSAAGKAFSDDFRRLLALRKEEFSGRTEAPDNYLAKPVSKENGSSTDAGVFQALQMLHGSSKPEYIEAVLSPCVQERTTFRQQQAAWLLLKCYHQSGRKDDALKLLEKISPSRRAAAKQMLSLP